MIPGDIDLTEKLDFRKVVRKEIPQLPAEWNGKDRLSTKNNTFLNITSTVRTTTYQMRSPIQYWYDDDWNTISGYYDSESIISANLSRRTNTYLLYDNFSIWYDDDYNTIEYSSSANTSTSSYRTTISYGEPERDVFGNVKITEEKIPSIPWSLTKRRDTISNRSIVWKNDYYDGLFHRFCEDEETIPKIPWSIKPRRPDRDVDLTSVVGRAKNLISWLSDKSTREIENYLSDDEEVDLSYLTRMGWIRVTDAVIE